MMETTLARAALYNFLAAVFGELPTPTLLDSARQIVPGLADESLSDLQREYTRLFIGPGEGYVPPCASVHLERQAEKPLLWGAEAVRVHERYRAAGLEIAPAQPRLPDYLALELQFMQHLCACQAEAWARGEAEEAAQWQAQQESFLREHLMPWLPRFAARVECAAARTFYPVLLRFALEFLQSEIEHLTAVAAV